MEQTENEITFSIKISGSSYTNLLQLFFTNPNQYYYKETYSNNKRILRFNDRTIFQIKKTSKFDKHVCLIKDHLLIVHHKTATEKVENIFEFHSLHPIQRIKRNFFFYKTIRFSVDVTVEDEEKLTHPNERIFHFNLEVENCEDIAQFVCVVEEYKQLKRMFTIIFASNHAIFNILNMDYNLSRPFQCDHDLEIENDVAVMYAPKLDGTKYMCIITPTLLTIPELNTSCPIESSYNQTLIGCVEHIANQNLFYVIDVLYILDNMGLYCRIDHINATKFMARNRLNGNGVSTNTFTVCLDEIKDIICNDLRPATGQAVEYDGYLAFYENYILKVKREQTVDLLFFCSKAVKLQNNLAKLFKFREGTTVHGVGYSIEKSFPMDCIKQQPNRQFYIVEFKIDFLARTLHFSRIRNDKAAANTVKSFREMENAAKRQH